MGKPKAPAPPDPVATAGAQTATNVGTAVANTAMGQVNQNTPYGSLEYEHRGDFQWQDPLTGRTYTLPQYTANTTLTPEAQEIFDTNLSAQLGLSQTADRAANFLPDYLGNVDPIDTSAVEGRLIDLGRERLDPMFADREEALRTSLVNRGIAEGSEIWNREHERFGQDRNDAYNQLLLTGRGQAYAEEAANRSRPINEITALLSGSQIQPPNVSAATPARAPTTDYAGIVGQNYNQQLGVYDREMNNWNSMMGGLFGLGAAGLRLI